MKSENKSRLVYEQGRRCTLSPLEYELFKWLNLYKGDILSRETLLKNVWGFRETGDTRSVDMCVKRLREKIGHNKIRTVYGKGYMLR
jgi:DNA-binding response OmpR family regulator